MPDTTDVLVIGGGLMGCSTAYALARQGVKATLVERRPQPGQETTARSGAIIRAHYGVPELVTLALEANRRYARFADEVGQPCGFVPSGYSVLVDAADETTLRSAVAMHQSRGVNVSLLSPAELGAIIPAVKTEDAALAAWEPDGGYASPQMTVTAYATQAGRFGANLRFDCPVTAAVREGTGWRVTLGGGTAISAGQIVLCTGNWSRPIGSLFGLDLPVTPVRAQIVVLERRGGGNAGGSERPPQGRPALREHGRRGQRRRPARLFGAVRDDAGLAADPGQLWGRPSRRRRLFRPRLQTSPCGRRGDGRPRPGPARSV